MEIEPLVVLGILYAILSIIGGATKAAKRSRTGARPRPPQPVPGSQPTTFDELLDEMRRQVEGARDTGHPDSIEAEWEPDPAYEEDVAWAEDPAVISTETESAEWDRPRRDHQAEAELLVQQRIAAALEHNRLRRETERVNERARREARDRRVKLRGSEGRADVAESTFSLRQAMVWREILSPPVALRDPQERPGNAFP